MSEETAKLVSIFDKKGSIEVSGVRDREVEEGGKREGRGARKEGRKEGGVSGI
jgi:hypothetical protein